MNAWRWTLSAALVSVPLAAAAADAVPDKVLFDFEDPADLKAWANLELPDAKAKEPPVRLELSTDGATSGKQSLKLTYAGGNWPTVTTTAIPDDWMPYQTFRADVTVSRHCLVGFAVLQEKSTRGWGWDDVVFRWVKTALLKPGRNEIVGVLHPENDYAINRKGGKVVRFEFFLYNPHDGETLTIDNIRLSAAKSVAPPAKTEFRVVGTDMTVGFVIELGKKLKAGWTKPTPKTVAQVEAEFRAQYEELKKTHPKAVAAIFRDGEKGWDPANPDKVYAGWKNNHINSHGPDGMTKPRSENRGKQAADEMFMRHRSGLMQVDLSSIPTGSTILAAKFMLVRSGAGSQDKGRNPEIDPNVWVAEPCNRPWEELEANSYEYAKDKFWKEIAGRYYGEDPDFLPIYFLLGPGGGAVSAWDFTEAVRFWTDGKHPNHGFMAHCDACDYMRAHFRTAADIKNRPAVMVIYEPK